MQSLGNDFVVFDAVRQSLALTPRQAAWIADRHTGIGCDQVLLAEAASDADFGFRIFNADGSEVGQCGNGARCLARFLADQGLTDKTEIIVRTLTSRLRLTLAPGHQVSVDMGIPEFDPDAIPMLVDARQRSYTLAVDGTEVDVSAVSMGNPHAVVMVADVDSAPVDTLGPAVEHHPSFPDRANVGFAQILDRRNLRLRVHERGVGETRACGSGACAAVAVGRDLGRLADHVTVELPGGTLRIDWPGPGQELTMTGPAHTVFDGTVNLEGL